MASKIRPTMTAYYIVGSWKGEDWETEKSSIRYYFDPAIAERRAEAANKREQLNAERKGTPDDRNEYRVVRAEIDQLFGNVEFSYRTPVRREIRYRPGVWRKIFNLRTNNGQVRGEIVRNGQPVTVYLYREGLWREVEQAR